MAYMNGSKYSLNVVSIDRRGPNVSLVIDHHSPTQPQQENAFFGAQRVNKQFQQKL